MDERALLAQLSPILRQGVTDDDCAVLEHGGEYLVWSTDMLHEHTDFPEGITDRQIGWMSAAVTLSDIAAMGAEPLALLVAVGLDRPERLLPLMEGAEECCRRFGAYVAGGDIDHHGELTVVTSGVGRVERELLVRRRGAGIGDAICVTGTLGRAEAGLEGFQAYRKDLLEPVPRVREGRAIARSGATCMMDISDGLALSLHDLARVNPLCFRIQSARVPIPPGIPKERALKLALFGGGDYELLFTIPPERLPIEGFGIMVIGRVEEGQGVFLDSEPLEARGYEHRWDA